MLPRQDVRRLLLGVLRLLLLEVRRLGAADPVRLYLGGRLREVRLREVRGLRGGGLARDPVLRARVRLSNIEKDLCTTGCWNLEQIYYLLINYFGIKLEMKIGIAVIQKQTWHYP